MTSYSYLDQVLHKQFLGDNSLSNYLHKRILKKSSTLPNKIKSKNIFITGLARSGTTALQNKIFSSGEIGSLMYKFMPFILYPKLAYKFSKLKSDKKTEIKERLHNDGIKININSPECLDENFWIKSDKKFYGKNYLRPISISNYLLDAYSYFLNEYQSVQGFDRMLIKNNNNHLRIKNLSEFFNESFFLVLFRDPLSHSISLLSQHRNFIKLVEKGFVKKEDITLEKINQVLSKTIDDNMISSLISKELGLKTSVVNCILEDLCQISPLTKTSAYKYKALKGSQPIFRDVICGSDIVEALKTNHSYLFSGQVTKKEYVFDDFGYTILLSKSYI